MSQIKKRKEPLEFSSSIFSALLGQTSKSGIVLESWQCAHFNSFPDIAIGPRFDGNIEEIPNSPFFLEHSVVLSSVALDILKF